MAVKETNTRIAITLSKETLKKFDEMIDKFGVSKSYFINEILDVVYKRFKKEEGEK